MSVLFAVVAETDAQPDLEVAHLAFRDMAADLAERFFQRPADHPSPGRARWGNLERL